MIPIAVLPIAGLMLGIGSAFTNGLMIETYGLTWLLGEGTVLFYVLSTMAAIGNMVFGNLPLIFAVGIASCLALRKKEQRVFLQPSLLLLCILSLARGFPSWGILQKPPLLIILFPKE